MIFQHHQPRLTQYLHLQIYETLVPSHARLIPFVNNPSESSTPNIDPIKPASIQVRGGSTWEMEEHRTILWLNSIQGKILVKQDDLSNVEYELTLKVDNIVKKVSLGTAQCIVVDNGLHDPYLLLVQSSRCLNWLLVSH